MADTYRILEHTADIGFEAYGATREQALEHAGIALLSIITDPDKVFIRQQKTIEITADDRQQLLVRYLNEILYLIDGESFLPAKIKVSLQGDTSLHAVLDGETRTDNHEIRTDVKAITYHQLRFERSNDGYVIQIFVDI